MVQPNNQQKYTPPVEQFNPSGGGGYGNPPRGGRGNGGGSGIGGILGGVAIVLVLIVAVVGVMWVNSQLAPLQGLPNQVNQFITDTNNTLAGMSNNITAQVNSAISGVSTQIGTALSDSGYLTGTQIIALLQSNGYITTEQLNSILQSKGYATVEQLNSANITALWDIVNRILASNDLLHNKIQVIGVSNVTAFSANATADNTTGSAHATSSFRIKITNNSTSSITLSELKINLNPFFDYSPLTSFVIDSVHLYWRLLGVHQNEATSADIHHNFTNYTLTNLDLTINAGNTEYVILYYEVYYHDANALEQADVVYSMMIAPTVSLVSYTSD